MDSLLFNKIAAGILVGLLLVMGIGKLGNLLYHPEVVAHEGTVLEAGGEEMALDATGAAEPSEEGMSLDALLNVADLDAGAAVSKKCASCHTFDQGGANRVGPNMWGVVGGPTAHAEGFAYSTALADMGGTWTFEALDAFLANPKGYLPGTKMTFAGLSKAEDRANLIAWLNQQSSSPIALPPPPAEEPAAEEAVETSEDAAADAGETVSAEETVVAAAEDTSGTANDATADAGAASGGADALVAAASPENGEDVAKKCRSCHTFDEGGANRVGPNLWGVVGRPVAGHEGFAYSSAMEEFGGDWTLDRLWAYIHDPRGVVPGTKMAFAGIKDDQDVADLLAWMRLQAAEPVPLAGQ